MANSAKIKNKLKMAVDILLTVFLLMLMSYQATGEKIHEWVGIGMSLLFVVHQALNLPWYKALLTGKGKWTAYRTVTTVTDLLLLVSMVLTAFSGMSMSAYAVPFLYGMAKLTLVRRMHLAFSHWTFVLAGFHLGLHIPAISARYHKDRKTEMAFCTVFTCFAALGLVQFIRSGILSYMFFIAAFAFFEPGKPMILVFFEYFLMFAVWAFAGYIVSAKLTSKNRS
ncbi:MAG: DUF4405 domain-containing protein [Oscillospiraceae bacterium]|nr:DUF4405 domain-containing protein [Oscillospiraceae bacterium]